MSELWYSGAALPPISYRSGDYATFRADLLTGLLREQGEPGVYPLRQLDVDDTSDWIVALCGAWASVAEIVAFYQERIINEAFLATAVEPSSVTRLFHALGHEFPPHATSRTLVSYTLSDQAAGFDAIMRSRSAGTRSRGGGAAAAGRSPAAGAGRHAGAGAGSHAGGGAAPVKPGTASSVPAQAKLRALTTKDEVPPTFVTLGALDAYVGASALAVALPSGEPLATVTAATTQVVLAGTKTGLAVGQPIVLAGRDPATGEPRRWARFLVSVLADRAAGVTRIGWAAPLDPAGIQSGAAILEDPVVYGFAKSVSLFGADAPAWASLREAQQLAAPMPGDGRVLPRGGVVVSSDGGQTWAAAPAGFPLGAEPSCSYAAAGLVLVGAAGGGLYVSTAGGPFAEASSAGLRQGVLSLGGSPSLLLAGTASGGVYRSVDNGRTWSPVRGGPPTQRHVTAAKRGAAKVVGAFKAIANVASKAFPAADAGIAAADEAATLAAKAGAKAKKKSAAPTSSIQVVQHQLPSVAVRAVAELGPSTRAATGGAGGASFEDVVDAGLLAGTDDGVYRFDGVNWGPDGLDEPVFALAPAGSILAATASGVYARSGSGKQASWRTYGSGLAGRVYALAGTSTVYAATDDGVRRVDGAGGRWQPANGSGETAIPAGTQVLALLEVGGALVAGTAGRGAYRSTDGGTSWTRCDVETVFTVPAQTLTPSATPQPVPPAILAAFADNGIPLAPTATIVTAGVPTITDPGGTYELASVGDVWEVRLVDALPTVGTLVGSGTTVVAAADQQGLVQDEWPGFAIHGDELVLSKVVSGVAADGLALIEQDERGTRRDAILDLVGVQQVAEARFSRTGKATVLRFEQQLVPGAFSRRASTVWAVASALPLARSGAAPVTTLSGTTIHVTTSVDARVASSRLGVVTGKPVGLVVVPVGGAYRIRGGEVSAAGPVQSDARAVVVADANVLLATAEGVFQLSPTAASPPVLLSAGWPSASAAAALAAAGTGGEATVLAATSTGILRLASAASAAWEPAGLQGTPVVALAAADSTYAVTGSGGVHVCADPGAQTPSWVAGPSLPGPPTALAARGTTVVAGTAAGVFRLDGGSWSQLPALPCRVACIAVDAAGTVWAGGAAGLYSLPAKADRWERDSAPAVAAAVEALFCDPAGLLVVAGPAGIATRTSSTTWTTPSSDQGAPVAGLAVAPDGSVWAATRAATRVDTVGAAQATQLAPELFFAGPALAPTDVATLDQGGVPTVVAMEFDDRHASLKAPSVSVRTPGRCWLVASGGDLYVLAARSSAGLETVVVYRSAPVAHALAPPTTAGGFETWQVEVSGVAGTLRAPAGTVAVLAAAATAPDLTETIRLGQPTPIAPAPGGGTTLALAKPLRHIYDASTVTVHLNVLAAAHGEQVSRPIGSGNPRVANQSMPVPTPVAAVAPDHGGTPATTLSVAVDGTPWTKVESLLTAAADDRVYSVATAHDGTAVVHFGDGVHGARLPPGHNNVVATYLQGGGAAGDAGAGAIVQALTRPALVAGVHNPVPATRPPLPHPQTAALSAVRTLGRVVSLADYAHLAAGEPGVVAATAELVATPFGREIVVTVAPAAVAPADLVDSVAATLVAAHASGPPLRVLVVTPVAVELAVELVVPGAVPDAADDPVAPAVRAALAGLTSRRPGEPLYASQVVAAAGAVPRVAAARIVSWHRADREPTTAAALPARGAGWSPVLAAPTPAELLVVDGSPAALSIDVQPPAAEQVR